jgi:hypothetical protein
MRPLFDYIQSDLDADRRSTGYPGSMTRYTPMETAPQNRLSAGPRRMNMPLSIVDLYSRVLPRTNCGDCGYSTCMAFASMVVSKKLPLSRCPYLTDDTLARFQPELDAQHAAGKWTERDMAADALNWARKRASSMALADLPGRIGGVLTDAEGGPVLVLPYFSGVIHIRREDIRRADGSELGRWEQVFILNHMAQGGRRAPYRPMEGASGYPQHRIQNQVNAVPY